MLLAGAVIAKRIRSRVAANLGYTLSAGIAHNKPLAKIASDSRKPNKQTAVPASAAPYLMRSLRVQDVPSLGGKWGQQVVAACGTDSVAQILESGRDRVRAVLGQEQAGSVIRALEGHGDSVVRPRTLTKQLMSAKSFKPVSSLPQCDRWISVLANELAPRILEDSEENERWPRGLALMYRHVSVRSQAMRSKQGPMPAIDIAPTSSPQSKGVGQQHQQGGSHAAISAGAGDESRARSERELSDDSASAASGAVVAPGSSEQAASRERPTSNHGVSGATSSAAGSAAAGPDRGAKPAVGPSDRLAAAAMSLLRQVPAADLLPCNRIALVANSFIPRDAGTDLSAYFGGRAGGSTRPSAAARRPSKMASRLGAGGGLLGKGKGRGKSRGGASRPGAGSSIASMLTSMPAIGSKRARDRDPAAARGAVQASAAGLNRPGLGSGAAKRGRAAATGMLGYL